MILDMLVLAGGRFQRCFCVLTSKGCWIFGLVVVEVAVWRVVRVWGRGGEFGRENLHWPRSRPRCEVDCTSGCYYQVCVSWVYTDVMCSVVFVAYGAPLCCTSPATRRSVEIASL